MTQGERVAVAVEVYKVHWHSCRARVDERHVGDGIEWRPQKLVAVAVAVVDDDAVVDDVVDVDVGRKKVDSERVG